MSICRVPFENDLIFSVAIYISDGSVVGNIGIFLSRRSCAICRRIKRNIDIACRCVGRQGVATFDVSGFCTVHNWSYGISSCFLTSICIPIKGSCCGRYFSYFLSVTIEVERSVYRIGREISPGNSYF